MPSAPAGLYPSTTAQTGLLYIGVSKHFGVRWQQHAQKQPWWNERRRMTVDFYDDREEALDAEALAIFTEQPKYNVLHRKQAQRLETPGPGPPRQPECGGDTETRVRDRRGQPTPPYWTVVMTSSSSGNWRKAPGQRSATASGFWSDCQRRVYLLPVP